jgi:1-acyl-sn-glycerol-3-phosphate acyltransferase
MNPIVKPFFELFRAPWMLLWHASGWKLATPFPETDKYVIIAAPHTTNWDYWHVLMASLKLRRRPLVTMKKEWFFFPLGVFLRLLGALPIDRGKNNSVIQEMADKFKERDRMVMVFSVEGSRKYTPYWKTGFYYTAHLANVPIMCVCIDYKHKHVGLRLVLQPTGNLEEDFEKIKACYMEWGRNPLYPDLLSDIALKPKTDTPND